MEAQVVTLAPVRVVALRHYGAYYRIGSKFEALAKWANAHGIPVSGAIGLYHRDPRAVPEEELVSDACLPVPDDFVLPETDGLDLRMDTVAGGDHAMTTHTGPYDGLGEAWGKFVGVQVPALGRELAHAPSFEIYVNDCGEIAPEDVRTDLYVPLA